MNTNSIINNSVTPNEIKPQLVINKRNSKEARIFIKKLRVSTITRIVHKIVILWSRALI